MRARSLQIALVGLVAALAAPASAAELLPVGRWKTIDDATGKPKSVVQIYEESGKLFGKIERLIIAPGADPNPKCDKCEGERKDQPVVGMVILWDLEKDKGGSAWGGGRILDPKNGKTYRCLIEPLDGGKQLKVRGYLGISLIGRTQQWLRME
jgi:uncharacterized protein (DUF2147 family)